MEVRSAAWGVVARSVLGAQAVLLVAAGALAALYSTLWLAGSDLCSKDSIDCAAPWSVYVAQDLGVVVLCVGVVIGVCVWHFRRSMARVVATLCEIGMLASMTVIRGLDLWILIPAAFCCVALAGIVAAGHSGLADPTVRERGSSGQT